jgi:hypothetical protein
MAGDWWSDDDRLLAALAIAVRAGRTVPRDFVETAKAAYAWHDIDVELAELTYDSALDEDRASAGTRAAPAADPATLRALTFASAELTIELEVSTDALLGQIVPPQPGQMEVRAVNGDVFTATIDEIGCFVIRPMPASSFRLHCHTAEGANVLSDWVRL